MSQQECEFRSGTAADSPMCPNEVHWIAEVPGGSSFRARKIDVCDRHLAFLQEWYGSRLTAEPIGEEPPASSDAKSGVDETP